MWKLKGYHLSAVSDEEPTAPLQVPDDAVDPLFSRAASPFMRTSAPEPVAFASPPGGPALMPMSTWITYKTQIQFGFAILAYLMVLVGSITVVQANPAMVAEVQKRSAAIIDDWIKKASAKGVDARAALNEFHAELKKVASEK